MDYLFPFNRFSLIFLCVEAGKISYQLHASISRLREDTRSLIYFVNNGNKRQNKSKDDIYSPFLVFKGPPKQMRKRKKLCRKKQKLLRIKKKPTKELKTKKIKCFLNLSILTFFSRILKRWFYLYK